MTIAAAQVRRGSVDRGSVRVWLAVDAMVTGLNAVAYVAAAGPIGELLGAEPEVLRGVGLFLLGFTGLLVLAARHPAPEGTPVRAIVVANAIWAVASVAVATAGLLDLDVVGRAWVLAQAVVVGAFAVIQGRTGWRRH